MGNEGITVDQLSLIDEMCVMMMSQMWETLKNHHVIPKHPDNSCYMGHVTEKLSDTNPIYHCYYGSILFNC